MWCCINSTGAKTKSESLLVISSTVGLYLIEIKDVTEILLGNGDKIAEGVAILAVLLVLVVAVDDVLVVVVAVVAVVARAVEVVVAMLVAVVEEVGIALLVLAAVVDGGVPVQTAVVGTC